MLNFQYSSLINAPVKTVWDFYDRADILEKLTPPWQPVKIIRREGGLGIGALSEFRLFLGFIPIKWLARHTQCEPYHFFVDEQVEGPMKSWRHFHQFKSEGEKTRLVDAIEYEIPGGSLVELFLGWWVELRLREMFRYRHEVTKRECELS